MRLMLWSIVTLVVLAGCGGATSSETPPDSDHAPTTVAASGASTPPSTTLPSSGESAVPATSSASVPQVSVQQPEVPAAEIPDPDVPAPEIPDPLFPDLETIELPEFQVPGVATGLSDETTVFTVDATVLFDFDEADLRPDAITTLEAIVAAIEANGLAGPVLVAGHTDAIGSEAYNIELSNARSTAVADWLHAQAPLADREITGIGYGESRPVASNTKPDGSDDPDGRQRNRRVEIAVG